MDVQIKISGETARTGDRECDSGTGQNNGGTNGAASQTQLVL